MKPLAYAKHLQSLAKQLDLPASELQPDATSYMTELYYYGSTWPRQLPKDYEEFLVSVGTGKEHGGLALWLRTDTSFSYSIVRFSELMLEEARNLLSRAQFARYRNRGLLFFLNTCDGTAYAFPKHNKYKLRIWGPEVVAFDRETGETNIVAQNFASFLDWLADTNLEPPATPLSSRVTSVSD